jgi:hypothetical protein
MLLLALALLAVPLTPARASSSERAAVRLRYGLSFREGAQLEAVPRITYAGMTPNDVGLWAAVFSEGWLGGWAGVQREGLSLSSEGGLVTGGGLLRASVGPAARVLLGPVRAEVSAGYGFAQLPAFAWTGAVSMVPAVRHAALLGGRALFPLPWGLRAEVRGELPLALATRDGAGEAASSHGFAAGGALLVPLGHRGDWGGALVLDYQYVQDGWTSADGGRSRQAISRMGAAFEFSFGGARGEMAEAREVKEVPRPPAPVVAPREGALRLSVVDARGGEPLPGASISVPGRTEAFSDAAGQVLLEGLAPGPWEVKVAAGGFRPEQVAVLVIAGEVTALDVSLAAARQGPVYATLSGQVRSVHKGQPLQAWLVIPEAKVRQRTDARGSFQIQLKQGRYRVILSAPGHLTQTKVITVREGEQAIFNVDLFPKPR